MDNFKTIWTQLSADEKRDLAMRMDTSVPYLSQVAHGHAVAGKHFSRLLSQELTRQSQQGAA